MNRCERSPPLFLLFVERTINSNSATVILHCTVVASAPRDMYCICRRRLCRTMEGVLALPEVVGGGGGGGVLSVPTWMLILFFDLLPPVARWPSRYTMIVYSMPRSLPKVKVVFGLHLAIIAESTVFDCVSKAY